jgi:hypothetical protein
MNEYKLSDVERKLLVDLNGQAQQAAAAAIAPFNKMSEGVLTLIALQQGLAGNWQLTDDKSALVKQEG